MNRTLLMLLSASGLAATLTLSHFLLRAAVDFPQMQTGWFLRVGAALALYGGVFIAYTWLLRHLDLSALYPIYTGLSILGVAAVGILYFNEPWTPSRLAGVICLTIGVSLVARG